MSSGIKYKSFWAENFRSFEKLNFTIEPGKHLVVGENQDSSSATSNGSGKSNTFLAPVFAQFKKLRKIKDPSFKHGGGVKTGVEFERDGVNYVIERHYKHKSGKNSLNLYIDGEDVSKRLKKGSEEEIKNIIGMSFDLFTSTIIIEQGLPTNFSQLTEVGRKSVVEELLGFSVFTEYYKPLFDNSKKRIQQDQERVKEKYNESRDEMVRLNSKIEAQESAEESKKAEIRSQVKEVKKKIKDLEDNIQSKMDEKKRILDGQDSQHLQASLNKMSNTLTTLRNRKSDLDQIVQQQHCPTCGQSFPEEKISNAQDELSKIQNKIPKIESMYQDIGNKLNQINSISQEVLNSEGQKNSFQYQLDSLFAQLKSDSSNVDLDNLKEKLDEVADQVNALNEELNSINEDVDNLEYISKLLLPSSPFRSFVLERYLIHINKIISHISPLLFEEVKVELSVTENNKGIQINIEKNGEVYDYDELSGGEKKRLDIIFILAFQRFLIESSGIRSNLLVFDEIFDSLDDRGIELVLSCIDSLFPESSSIYIITHNKSVKSMFNSVKKVIKKNGVSVLEGSKEHEELANSEEVVEQVVAMD